MVTYIYMTELQQYNEIPLFTSSAVVTNNLTSLGLSQFWDKHALIVADKKIVS